MTELTPEQEARKAAYIRARGYWKPWTEGLLRLHPDFLDAYARYAGHPAAHGPLSPVMCELIYVALDASATHLFESGLKLHMRLALERGATARQLVEVLRLATLQGLDGVAMGLGLLVEELEKAGQPLPPPDPAHRGLREAYEARFGDWPDFCDQMLRLDPAYFAALLDLLSCGDGGDGLDEKSAALISVALSACFTARDPAATRLHLQRALRLGATREELLQVLQMTAHLGVHACSLGVPALMDVMG